MNPNVEALQDVRRFEMAADYIRTNGLTTPIISFGMALALWQWWPAAEVFTWAAIASAGQIAMGLAAHFALKEPEKLAKFPIWRGRVMACSLVAGLAFGSAFVLFYVPGERLNNLLLVAASVASISALAGMTSPDRRVMVVSTAPHCVFLLSLIWLYEPYPFNWIFAALAVAFLIETFVTADKLRRMVSNLVELQTRNDALIETLETEKQQANAARMRAENASRAKSNFLANMSHELRTPLNAILGFSEIIRERVFGDAAMPRYSAYASDIHQSGAHLLNLIDDILDLSRVEAGTLALFDTDIDVGEIFKEVARFVGQQAAAKDISIAAEASEECLLRADHKAVKQILINLAANAVKFTPMAGTVTLSQIVLDGKIQLSVKDTGIGIHASDLSRVMERFGQARHDVAAAPEQGVGLGLPIARGLAAAHDAELTLTSNVGEGTIVRLTFPANRTIAKTSAAA